MKGEQGRLGEGPPEWSVSLRKTGHLLSKTGVRSQSKALAVTVEVGWLGSWVTGGEACHRKGWRL